MRVNDFTNFKSLCTGCQACFQICPVHAITMSYSEDGFLYPEIDEQLCVQCGMCGKVCPIEDARISVQPLNILSVYALDSKILLSSSSGGVFTLLANQVLKDDGAVFGAYFDANCKEVRHGSTDNVPLSNLLRSKYVQSNIGSAYIEAADVLQAGRTVLFCGTPCQIRGLNSYLTQKHITGNLLTVDFKCHGVPSPQLFHKFLDRLEISQGAKLVDFTFREKDLGWGTQIMKAYFDDDQIWIHRSLSHYFYYMFLNNYILRDSCYSCTEYCEHCSDLTLADDWISTCKKDDRGTSLVFINSVRGRSAVEAVKSDLNITSVQSQISNLEVYSHRSYDRNKKTQWLNAWKQKGFDYVIGPFYFFHSFPLRTKESARRYLSAIKYRVKKLLRP